MGRGYWEIKGLVTCILKVLTLKQKRAHRGEDRRGLHSQPVHLKVFLHDVNNYKYLFAGNYCSVFAGIFKKQNEIINRWVRLHVLVCFQC